MRDMHDCTAAQTQCAVTYLLIKKIKSDSLVMGLMAECKNEIYRKETMGFINCQ